MEVASSQTSVAAIRTSSASAVVFSYLSMKLGAHSSRIDSYFLVIRKRGGSIVPIKYFSISGYYLPNLSACFIMKL